MITWSGLNDVLCWLAMWSSWAQLLHSLLQKWVKGPPASLTTRANHIYYGPQQQRGFRDSMSGSHLAGVLLGLLGALVVLVAVVTVIFKCRKRQSKCCWNQGRTTSRPASLPEVYAVPLDSRHLPRGEVQPDILQQIASLVQRSAPGEVNPAPACVVAGDTELPPPYSSLDLPPPYSSVVMKTAAEAEQRL